MPFAVKIGDAVKRDVATLRVEQTGQQAQHGAFARAALSQQDGGGRLDGTWDVVLTARNCQTGTAIASFAELATFMSGGTVIDSTSGVAQSLKTPGQGIWSHVSGNTYRFSFKSLNLSSVQAPSTMAKWMLGNVFATVPMAGCMRNPLPITRS